MELSDLIKAENLNLLREARDVMIAEGWRNFPEVTEANIVVHPDGEVYFSFDEENAGQLFIGSMSKGTSALNPMFAKRLQEVTNQIKKQKQSPFGQPE